MDDEVMVDVNFGPPPVLAVVAVDYVVVVLGVFEHDGVVDFIFEGV